MHGVKIWFETMVSGMGGTHGSGMAMAETQYCEDGIYTASSPAVILQSVHLFQNHCKFSVIAEIIVCFVYFLHAHY